MEKERMQQDVERLRSSPLQSPQQPEETRVVPSIDATMVCFIDADGCAEAAAPLLSASSAPDSPVGKTISNVKTTYQPTLVTPGAQLPFKPLQSLNPPLSRAQRNQGETADAWLASSSMRLGEHSRLRCRIPMFCFCRGAR